MARSMAPAMIEAVVDKEASMVLYLAFDLMLAEAPIRDGAVHIQDSRPALANPDDPATGPKQVSRPRT